MTLLPDWLTPAFTTDQPGQHATDNARVVLHLNDEGRIEVDILTTHGGILLNVRPRWIHYSRTTRADRNTRQTPPSRERKT